MYTLNSIKETSDKYLVQQVSCIEKPVSIVLDSYNNRYKSLFLMYLKMIQSYNFKRYENINTIQEITEILKKELSIELFCEKTNDIHVFIEKNIDKNNPIMILGNLRELYYSKYYKKDDWPHLFIIKGYDKANKLYYVLDSTQIGGSEENNYYNFVIPYEIIENMYISFNNNLFEVGIYYFESEKTNTTINYKKMLDRCLEMMIEEISENPYREKSICNEILSRKISESEIFIKIYHFKVVFYNELSFALSTYINDAYLYNKYTLLKNELLDTWKNVDSKIVYYLYKNMKEKIQNQINIGINKEQEMRRLIDELRYELRKYDVSEDTIETAQIRFENNEDNIISINKDGAYVFNFKNEKIYNSWLSDGSPKVVLSNIDDEEIKLTIKVNLLEYSEMSKFFAGIFVKTNKNSMYYWGINCGLSVRLEHTGINSNVFEVPNCLNEVILEINITKNKCDFSYSFDSQDNMERITQNIISIDEVTEYGFGCKTWDEPNKILLCIEQLQENQSL